MLVMVSFLSLFLFTAQAGDRGCQCGGQPGADGSAGARRVPLGGNRVRDGQPRNQQEIRLDRRRLQSLQNLSGILLELREDRRSEWSGTGQVDADSPGLGSGHVHRRRSTARTRSA